jgi:hypothetical protein
MTEPVNLGWGKVCEVERLTSCETDTDCPMGEACVQAQPVLSFKHQVSLLDHRGINANPNRSSERAVVSGQLVDDAGEPVSDWIRLEPYVNAYDTDAEFTFYNCTFDPIDDGNTEVDLFDPTDLIQFRFGPSSSCFPHKVFADQGDTFRPFDPDDLGDASDGPGLEGSQGLGTWIEPKFSLDRFLGRRIRLRFLATGQKLGGFAATWQEWQPINPTGFDDGWFIDDVMISDALEEPATVSIDTKDNTAVKADWDFDGIGSTCDCAPNDETAWMLPGEATGLVLSHSGGLSGVTELTWDVPTFLGGVTVGFDTLRSTVPNDFVALATCVESSDGPDTMATDLTIPDAGTVQYFLVRATNNCGNGALGEGSAGIERLGGSCP